MRPPGRTHIKGLDKPTAAPLTGAADPLLMLRSQASVHEQHRLESVAETLVLMGVICARKVVSGREIVSVIGASSDGFQWGTGVAKHKTVAAHCLPGHLEINSFPFHRMPNWTERFLSERGLKPLQLHSKLKNVCGRTDVVDEVVNKTDNLVEKMAGSRGLKPRLGGAVRQLLERVLVQRPDHVAAMSELVLSAMSYYRLGAGYVCEERLDWLEDQLGSPGDSVSSDQRQRQIFVAEQYLQVLQDRAFIPEPCTMSGVSDIVRDVVADAH